MMKIIISFGPTVDNGCTRSPTGVKQEDVTSASSNLIALQDVFF